MQSHRKRREAGMGETLCLSLESVRVRASAFLPDTSPMHESICLSL